MENNSSVCSVVEKGANYIFHLMNTSIAGLDNNYASKYSHTIINEDRRTLNESRKLIAFNGGELGQIARAVVFFPACLNLSSENEIEDYFLNLNLTLENENPEIFINKHNSGKEKLINWFSPVNGSYLKYIIPYKSTIKELGEIYLRNFKKFEETVWKLEEPHLNEVEKALNHTLNESNLIQIWEAVTGERFEYGIFEAVICNGSENRSITNILGYNRAFFYSGTNQKSLLETISYEVGRYILINAFKKVIGQTDLDLDIIRRAFENLVIFYNTIILGKSYPCCSKGKYFDNSFVEIYNDIYLRRYDLKPEYLLTEGIKIYSENSIGNFNSEKLSF